MAQSPKIEASINTEDPFIGETITYQVDIQNIEDPQPPDLSALEGFFEIEPAGDYSRNQSSTTIFNGRMTQKNVLSHVYSYKLTPKKSGQIVIPPVTSKIDGQVYRSNSVTISIRDIEEQSVVLAQTVLDNPRVYPTQSFSVTLRIHVKGLPDSTSEPIQAVGIRRRREVRELPHLQVEWLKPIAGLTTKDTSEWLGPLLSRNGVGFTLNEVEASSGSLFGSPRSAVFNLLVGREKRTDDQGEKVEYFVYELKREYTAERAGRYTFGSSMVKGTFITGQEGNAYVGRRIVAIASPVTVEVKDIPEPRPAGFTGGIGKYEVVASANPTKLRVGDPLTLSLEFERGPKSGSLDLIAAPQLQAFPEVVNDFEVVDSNPTGRIDGRTKKFGYAIRPKRPGVSIPALTFSSFDPVTENFTEVSTKAIPLFVSESSQVNTADIVGSVATSSSSNNALKSSNKGIFQIVSDTSLLRDERVDLWTQFQWVIGAWSALGVCAIGLLLRRNRSADTVRQRRQRAAKIAQSRLSEAARIQRHDHQEAMRTIRSAIIGLVADTTNQVAEGMTAADVAIAVKTAKVPEADQAAINALLSDMESSEYGGGTGTSTDEIVRKARRVVDKIAPYLERGFR